MTDPTASENLLICVACGTQFDVPASKPLASCRICDDPRQFVPPTGQRWTSLAEMRGKYENKWEQDPVEPSMWSIWTEPKFAIGQRAILIETPEGNVLWDLITYLDEKTIEFIHSRGPLLAIVISHPHYYTTHLHWSSIFDACPVYTAIEDASWFSREDASPVPARHFIADTPFQIPISPSLDKADAVTALKPGGHFPGSLVLHFRRLLLIADTFVTVPSGMNPHPLDPTVAKRLVPDASTPLPPPEPLPGTTTYSFMWSIPNMIPLGPADLSAMWHAVKGFRWDSTHGAFVGMDVRRVGDDGKEGPRALLESMKIQARGMGWADHGLLKEKVA
ncbi:beta-lactamase-like protein [Phyllosticta capitalensis]|uniref:Beta-lactamase-like protein n=1 Tax=Phyllosticta capitalensis TaxID=121624 RepID=A0ABR1YDD9_9PEZI